MSNNNKISKEAVLYIHKKDTLYKCRDCLFAKDGANRCALYGASVAIKPFGSCGLFVKRKGQADMGYIGGYTKENTGYVENQDGFSCARCEEFLPEQSDCQKVDKDSPGDDPGKITAGACCNRWEKLGADE